MLTNKEKKAYSEWLEEKKAVQREEPSLFETPDQRAKRIKMLLGNFSKFCAYYLGHYMKSEFGWFHKKGAKDILADPDIFLIAEWPREHAKSVLFDVMIPLFLKARGELTGMMIGSSNGDKAGILLGDIQAELMFNKRFVADFGEQYLSGKWEDGTFVTTDGVGFWSFGRGQSPRGTRSGEKRPNYGVIDDVDDATIVKNEGRVDEAVDWVLGDFFGAMPNKGSRLVIAGNRIHKKSILAKLVGDVEDNDPKREGIDHIKVFALENPKTHKKDLSENGVPAWKENYTYEEIMRKMKKQGMRIGLREFFHEHIVIGRVFKEEHLPWAKLPQLSVYEKLVTYNDPSYKDTKRNDFKSIVLMGKIGVNFDIIKVFCRQCSTAEMVRGHYNLADLTPENKICQHWMEANFIQDLMLKQYETEGLLRGHFIAIRGDFRAKPDKTSRIEDLSAHTEVQHIRFNQEEKHNPDMIELRNQFLGFPDAPHDDGPDSVEGAIYKLNKPVLANKTKAITGKYKHKSARRG